MIASPSATWRLAIWDTATRQLVRLSEFIGPYHEGVARSPAGPLLATMNGDTIRSRNLASDQVVEFAHGHRRVGFLDFNADGRHLLSTAPGEPIKIWDVSTGRLLATVPEERLPGGVLDHDRQLLSPDARRRLRFRGDEYPTTRTQIKDLENNRADDIPWPGVFIQSHPVQPRWPVPRYRLRECGPHMGPGNRT